MKTYEPVGHCIYCGADGTAVRLTDEHIIPYALLGDLLLPKSSCEACATITSRLEMFMARNTYGSFRAREGLRTRRPKKRPKTVKATGRTGVYDIPEKGGIAAFPIIKLPPPGLLHLPPKLDASYAGTTIAFKFSAPREPEHLTPYARDDPSFAPVALEVTTFARLCAKIAHGFAVATFGTEGFQPLLASEVLNPTAKLPLLVGGSSQAPRPGSIANSLVWHGYETAAGLYLGVDVHLFPSLGQPPVTALTGALTPEQFAALKERADVSRS